MSHPTPDQLRALDAAAAFDPPPGPGDPCLLCSRPAEGFGTFAPRDSQLYGAPAGKVRGIRYPLCSSCAARPGAFRQVELELLRRLRGDA